METIDETAIINQAPLPNQGIPEHESFTPSTDDCRRDTEQFTLDHTLPLALLPPDTSPLVPDPLPDTLLPEPVQEVVTISSESTRLVPGPTFDASRTPSPQRQGNRPTKVSQS